jgi:heme/copper-type cytochrome/quinol oxidase subunit 4
LKYNCGFGGGNMDKRLVQFVLGIIVILIGVVMMLEGSFLGETTIGIATVIVVIGIGLISTSSYRLLK